MGGRRNSSVERRKGKKREERGGAGGERRESRDGSGSYSAPDSRLWTLDSGHPTQDTRLWTPDSGLPTQDSFAQGTEPRFLLRRQRSLQYFTFSQSSSHFLGHSNSRLQTGQVFVGRVPSELAMGSG